MVLCLYLFALSCGVNRGLIKKESLKQKLADASQVSSSIEKLLQNTARISEIAKKYSQCTSALFIGRHWNFPAALESALKLKEVSYIHAEGLAGGELKHGTLALVEHSLPVFAIAPRDEHYGKMMSNIREVKARSGCLIGLGNPDDQEFKSQCQDYIEVPFLSDSLNPILSSVALQLLAYHVALARGVDIDRPRNLAKSLTVE
jgi:glucosamine--fructose-6-phosphate aminotransferase (isomerizing)